MRKICICSSAVKPQHISKISQCWGLFGYCRNIDDENTASACCSKTQNSEFCDAVIIRQKKRNCNENSAAAGILRRSQQLTDQILINFPAFFFPPAGHLAGRLFRRHIQVD